MLTIGKILQQIMHTVPQLKVDQTLSKRGKTPAASGEFNVWTGYRIPEDRSEWTPLVSRFYDYWLSVAPPSLLPGRQHIVPEAIAPLWSRLWLLDVSRDPLRFRYRFCGTDVARSYGREVTGAWLDEAHPQHTANPLSRERFRFAVETGQAAWRRGAPIWIGNSEYRTIESCIAPLASDGVTVDKLFGISVSFDTKGRRI
jgi:hypothetical protein